MWKVPLCRLGCRVLFVSGLGGWLFGDFVASGVVLACVADLVGLEVVGCC